MAGSRPIWRFITSKLHWSKNSTQITRKKIKKFRYHDDAKLRKLSRNFVLKTPLKYRARSRKRLPKFLIFLGILQYLIRQSNRQSFEEIGTWLHCEFHASLKNTPKTAIFSKLWHFEDKVTHRFGWYFVSQNSRSVPTTRVKNSQI